jgi:hypothetical protein
VHGNETTIPIKNFLQETSGVFVRIDLFDIVRPSTGATAKLLNLASAATWQILPTTELPFVLFA